MGTADQETCCNGEIECLLDWYAGTLYFAGRREEAVPLFREALRLNPKPPNVDYRHFGVALRDSGRYEEAIAVAKKAVEQEPKDTIAYMVLASSCQLAGREEEARSKAAEVMKINPEFSSERAVRTLPIRQARADELVEAWLKAGLK